MKPSVGRTWGNLYSIAAELKCKSWGLGLSLIAVMCSFPLPGVAQSFAASTIAASPVPQFVNYAGALADIHGKALTGVTGVTFLLYKESQGGAPLWMETQNVNPDKTGHYSVMLGSTTSQGLPQDVFVSGEARWLAVQVVGQEEQPRVLLVAVPYALKAGDAETIGGLPASAFVLANGTKGSTASASAGASPAATPATSSPTANPTVTGKGVANFIPMWDTNRDIIDSLIFEKSGNIGINETVPAATLDVNGKGDVRDTLTLFPKGTNPTLAVNGTTFKIDQTGKVTFAPGQAFPGAGTLTGITTSAGSGLSGGGSSGTLKLGLLTSCSSGQTLGWNGSAWACKTVSGSGTVSSVALSAPSSDFKVTGSPVTSSGTLGLNWNVAPTSARTANAIVKRDSSGSFSAANIGANTASFTDPLGIGSAVLGASPDPGATAITGLASASTGEGFGVQGESDSGDPVALGVFGYAPSSTGSAKGVEGLAVSGSGAGVYGVLANPSLQGAGIAHGGVWGDTNHLGGYGVLATADDGTALFALNSSSDTTGYFDNVDGSAIEAYNTSVNNPTAFFSNEESSFPNNLVLATDGSSFNGQCNIDVSGNLSCNGSVTAVVPAGGGSRQVALNTISSPEHWFEDAGSGQLSNGEAVVNIEAVFGETVNTGMDYHVFLTPNGDCKGLYVSQKSPNTFEVHELGGGTSNITFDYRIMAKRKGYEQIRLADKTKQFERPKLPRRRVSSAPATIKPGLPKVLGIPLGQATAKPAGERGYSIGLELYGSPQEMRIFSAHQPAAKKP